MSFLDSIRSSLSTSKAVSPGQPGSDQTGSGTAKKFNNMGQEIVPESSSPKGNGEVDPASTPSSNGTGSGAKSIEELLFSDPAPSSASNGQETSVDPKDNKKTGDELAPGYTMDNLMQNIRRVNIGSMLNKEVVQAALGGDETAFMQILNTSTQLGAALAIKESVELSNKAAQAQFDKYGTEVDSRITESQYNEIYSDTRFGNPIIRPMVENLVQRLRQHDPKITVSQIKETLPALLRYTMNNINLAEDSINSNSSNGKNSRTNGATAINFEELWNS